jgi:hypothetical protein
MHSDIHSLNGIRPHDPSVRASKDSSCLWPRGHWERYWLLLHALNELYIKYISKSCCNRRVHWKRSNFNAIWSRWPSSRSEALLQKPPVAQLLKNFPAFYGNQMFISVFTRALRWSLSLKSIKTSYFIIVTDREAIVKSGSVHFSVISKIERFMEKTYWSRKVCFIFAYKIC